MKEERGKWGIFEGAGVIKRRAVVDAGPYGEVTSSAVGRDDVGAVPYGGFYGVQGYIGWNYRVRLG